MTVWYSGQIRADISDGPFDSRDAAIAYGRKSYQGGTFFIGQGETVAATVTVQIVNIEQISAKRAALIGLAKNRTKIDDLIKRFEPDIRSAFQAAIQDIDDKAILSDIVTAIEQNDIVGAFRAVGYTQAALRPLTAAIERAYETGGETVAETFPKTLNTPSGKAVFRFDVRNTRAETWLREKSSTLVTNLTDEAQTNVRQVIEDGVSRGVNPRNIALDIIGRIDKATGQRTGGIVGLTNNQEGWVRSARAKLETLDSSYFNMELRDKRFDPTVQAAIDAKKPLSQDTVDKLITRYKDNALRYRGETIARTEAIQALNQSEYEALKQAVDSGAITAANVKRVWDSAGDARVRPSHVAMDGQTVTLDEPFTAPSGAQLMFPGDISLGADAGEIVNCRCRVRTAVDWLADLD